MTYSNIVVVVSEDHDHNGEDKANGDDCDGVDDYDIGSARYNLICISHCYIINTILLIVMMLQ